MALSLPAMAPGGRWFKTPDDRPACYVTHEAHIQRMIKDEGAQAIDDPRTPQPVVLAPPAPPSPTETALRAEIDELKTLVAQLVAAPGASTDGEAAAHPKRK